MPNRSIKSALQIIIVFLLTVTSLPILKPKLTQALPVSKIFLPLVFKEKPLTVGMETVPQTFNPFFSLTEDSTEILDLTQLSFLTIDRYGAVVNNAINGETRSHNGTPYTYYGPANTSVVYNSASDRTTYTATLRPDLKFSDGKPLSADDLIFTLYTLLDPSYDGLIKLKSLPIIGLTEYLTQVTMPVYNRYANLAELIHSAGRSHAWRSSDPWTQAQQTDFWARADAAVLIEVKEIVRYVMANYLESYSYEILRRTPAEVRASEGLQIAFGMALWGFGNLNTSDVFVARSGKTWNLRTTFPTFIDFRNEIYTAHNGNLKSAFPYESVKGTDVFLVVQYAFIKYWGTRDPEMGGRGIPNISGIAKLSSTTVQILLDGYSSTTIYTLFDIPITPLHHYGSQSKYDYANNKFGFDYGDLSKQRSIVINPLGAGPYSYVQYIPASKTAILNANPNYFKGIPKIRLIALKEIPLAQAVSKLASGSVDLYQLYYNRDRIQEIRNIISNGEFTGNIISSYLYDNAGFGYFGLNAGTMNVGNNPSSLASRNLRKGFATILAAHRYETMLAYYDGAVKIQEYSVIPSSWASPQPTDAGYSTAFSVDVNGNPIYSTGMTPEQRYQAARQAALGFFQAAGYTISNGRVTSAPTGAKIAYEFIIPGGGTGDHPAFDSLVAARDSLEMIGMGLTITDPADANVLWDRLDAGTQEGWSAAWGAVIDTDLYNNYHSSNILRGTTSNYYQINDPTLDSLILQSRTSIDQTARKELLRQSFNIIRDWGVEVPHYVRQLFTIMSTQRINQATVTPNITLYWDWTNDIELLELN